MEEKDQELETLRAEVIAMIEAIEDEQVLEQLLLLVETYREAEAENDDEDDDLQGEEE